jgi:hypothetical protein
MVQLTIQEQLEKVKQPFSEFADLLTFTVKEGKIVVTRVSFWAQTISAKLQV